VKRNQHNHRHRSELAVHDNKVDDSPQFRANWGTGANNIVLMACSLFLSTPEVG
jgi:hypothetical protein